MTVALEGAARVVNCDSTTGWAVATISGPSAETDIYMEGTQAVSAKASSKAGELYYDFNTGGGATLNFTSGGNAYQNLIFININVTTLKSLDTLANNGLSIRLYTDLTNYKDWTIAGSGYIQNFRKGKGGFTWFALDPTTTPTSGSGASFNLNSIRYIGVHIDTTASAKSENLVIDGLIVAKGLRLTGTDTDGWLDAVNYCTAYTSRAWGVMDYDDSENIIYVRGKIFIGDTAQSAVTSLTDTGRKIKFIHTEYYSAGGVWTPMVGDSYMGIEIQDHASYETTFTDGTLVGSDKGASGSLIEGDDDVDVYLDFVAGNNTSTVVKLYGTLLKKITGAITFANDADYKCFSVSFEACAQVDLGGAVETRNCFFINTADADAALLWNENIDIQDCFFISNTAGAAIEHPSAVGTPYSYYDLVFSGNTYDVYNSSGSSITVAKNGTSNPTTYEGSTVTFSGSVTITITCKNEAGYAVEGIRVRVEKTSDGSLVSEGTTNASGIHTDSYTGSTPLSVKVITRLKGYKFASALSSIEPTVGMSVPFTMIKDSVVDLP